MASEGNKTNQKKCLFVSAEGVQCDQDVDGSSNYCKKHGPSQSSHSSTGSFGTRHVDYAMTTKFGRE